MIYQYEYVGDRIDPLKCLKKVSNYHVNPMTHCHAAYEVMFVRSGNITVSNNPIVMNITEPCMLLHRPYSFHNCLDSGTQPYVRYSFYFTPEWAGEVSAFLPSPERLCPENMTVYRVPSDSICEWESLFELLCNTDDSISCGLLIACILRRTAKLTPISPSRSTGDAQSYITQVMEYISEHFTEHLTIDSLAEHFFVSRTKLTSDFRRVNASSIHEFIEGLRLEHACRLLHAGLNVTRCAMECGFSSYSSFIRAFTRRYASTPLRYARAISNDKSTDE